MSIDKALDGRHIVLGVTGGIAAYKSAILIRQLVKSGAEVQVIMTPSAREFITPLTLSTLSGKPVIIEFFNANNGEWHSHVDLGLWADAFVVAPATACTIGKMVHGIADNMLVTSYLSTRGQVFVAPAMDVDMMSHPSTTDNLKKLAERNAIIIESESGELASHLVGKGRMADPETIVSELKRYFYRLQKPSLEGKNFLVTAGPTYENIDPVRFIGNYSTGKMGYAIADELADRGGSVVLVSGQVSISPENKNVRLINVHSATDMLEAAEKVFDYVDCAVMCAAVADYAPENAYNQKIKREHQEVPCITLKKNPDIAAALGERKRDGQLLVGFALETEVSVKAIEYGRDKLKRKNLDMIVVNSLQDEGAGFGTDTNKVTIVQGDGREFSLPLDTKREIASQIVDRITEMLK